MDKKQNTSAGETIKERLPQLRRFARALIGDQNSGDALVLATLQRITKDKKILDEASTPTIALYKAFNDVFQSPAGQQCMADLEAKNFPYGCDATLSDLSLETRQAFLLTTMEQFSSEAAAEVLGLAQEEFERLNQASREEVAEQLSASVFIIEDELFIASDLEEIVTGLGHFVVGTARTREEAVKKLREVPADVILSDINLADGSSGIDAVNELLKVQTDISVIFITAYSERLLTGLRPEPTFLIEKPFTTDQIRAVLSQILFLKQKTTLPTSEKVA